MSDKKKIIEGAKSAVWQLYEVALKAYTGQVGATGLWRDTAIRAIELADCEPEGTPVYTVWETEAYEADIFLDAFSTDAEAMKCVDYNTKLTAHDPDRKYCVRLLRVRDEFTPPATESNGQS